MFNRCIGDGWAEWAIAHPGFGRSGSPISTREDKLCPPTVLLAHTALGSFLRPCYKINVKAILSTLWFWIITDVLLMNEWGCPVFCIFKKLMGVGVLKSIKNLSGLFLESIK